MFVQAARLGEPGLTDFTLEGLFARVDSHVFLQVGLELEGPIAVGTVGSAVAATFWRE